MLVYQHVSSFFSYFCSKVVLISFVAICSLAFVQSNTIKDAIEDTIYAAIHVVLQNQYPNEPQKAQCMLDHFRRNQVADKFFTPDIVLNTSKLEEEIKPYTDEANLACTLIG
jgi:hypothetical protein